MNSAASRSTAPSAPLQSATPNVANCYIAVKRSGWSSVEQVAHLVTREWLQIDTLDAAGRVKLREERTQRVAPVEFVAAVGHDEQEVLVAHAASQEEQQVARGAIGPMQVLDDDRERLLHGEPPEHAE